MLDRTVFWAPWSGPGLEHLRLREADGGYVATGTVLGLAAGAPFRLLYKIKCDAQWRTRKVILDCLSAADERLVTLRSDGKGNWKDDSGDALAPLAGCLEVDIAATPFTNTLAIRRLALRPGQQAEIRVAYVRVPGLELRSVLQRYRCLAREADGGRVLYEGLFRGFAGELPHDADGLVRDYPETFRRVYPA